ncbi:MAG: hypothetical protein JWO36_5241 [Myxococcales bacterium]|nr:hypothetical protein [Myxococcales bacterium]
MSRLVIIVVAISLASSGYAHAQAQVDIAARENEEGKDLMFGGRYAEASAKFRDAVARVPEAKYFFNLCTSLYQEGKFGEALTACNAVEKNNPDDKLHGKTTKLVDKIKVEAKGQGIDLQPTGGGGGDQNLTDPAHVPDGNPNVTGPTGPGPTGPGGTVPTGTRPQQPYAVGRPPTQGLFTGSAPEHNYTWSLGVDLFGGGANIGQPGVYGTASGGIRFKGDYIVSPASRVGVQGYLQITNIGAGNGMSTTAVGNLDIFDVGIAAYKHLCVGGRLCLTPLGGVSLAMMDPNQDQGTGSQTFNYAALGLRGEINASFAFGSRYEYVLQVMLGVNYYSRVLAEPTDGISPTAMDLGLDKGGPAGYFGVGFTYRFNTPFGQAPFVTLE